MKAPPARPTGPTAAHTIDIAAGAETVWAILADFARWGEWNPLYTRSQGRLAPGERIAFTVAVPGIKPTDGAATVYRVTRPALIEYGLSNAGGLLKAFRFIDIAETAPGHCTVTNGEIMTGPLGRLVALLLGGKVASGMQAMNEALKVRAEASQPPTMS